MKSFCIYTFCESKVEISNKFDFRFDQKQYKLFRQKHETQKNRGSNKQPKIFMVVLKSVDKLFIFL
ncbi:hypothetical protein B4U84_03705 [Westiellopsis prolifica IICB1]|nr:hypothetical protein B4U84_03705 [Westiellopsis prolifica IICB1]